MPIRQALGILQRGLGSETTVDRDSEHRLRLSMNDYAQASLLPALSTRLAAEVPRWTLQVQSDDARQMVRQLADGELRPGHRLPVFSRRSAAVPLCAA